MKKKEMYEHVFCIRLYMFMNIYVCLSIFMHETFFIKTH